MEIAGPLHAQIDKVLSLIFSPRRAAGSAPNLFITGEYKQQICPVWSTNMLSYSLMTLHYQPRVRVSPAHTGSTWGYATTAGRRIVGGRY